MYISTFEEMSAGTLEVVLFHSFPIRSPHSRSLVDLFHLKNKKKLHTQIPLFYFPHLKLHSNHTVPALFLFFLIPCTALFCWIEGAFLIIFCISSSSCSICLYCFSQRSLVEPFMFFFASLYYLSYLFFCWPQAYCYDGCFFWSSLHSGPKKAQLESSTISRGFKPYSAYVMWV